MLILWLGLMVFIWSPVLHHALHKDSQESTHNCLITELEKGVLSADVVPVVQFERPTTYFYLSSIHDSLDSREFDFRLPLTRGPPPFSPSQIIVG